MNIPPEFAPWIMLTGMAFGALVAWLNNRHP